MLKNIALFLLARAEKRLGVVLDYVRQIAKIDIKLLTRYNRIFGVIDPRNHLPADAYHTARIRAALAADCGTCVQAEQNLAKKSRLKPALIEAILRGTLTDPALIAVMQLTDAVVARREDDSAARDIILGKWGDAGLIELALVMNAAAMLPGIKRAMGYATACDISLMAPAKNISTNESNDMSTADALIKQLDLTPHPEGGWYRQTWIAEANAGERPAGTCIYFLLKAGESSRWHRVDAVEIWHYYAGAPLILSMAQTEAGPARDRHLGPDLAAGEAPQLIVPTQHWQAARSTGDYTLVGCTVSPGFNFDGFEMMDVGVEIPYK